MILKILICLDHLKDYALEEINRKYNEFGKFRDSIIKYLEDFINTCNTYEKFLEITEKNKNIIPGEFNFARLKNIKFSKKEIGFGSFDLTISTPYLSLSTDNQLQFCLKNYNQEIENIIPALYQGKYIKFNIISFVEKSVKSSLIFDEENLITKQMSINQITKHNESIIIKFEIPDDLVLEDEQREKISGKLNFELLEEKGMNLQIPFYFSFEFIPLNLIFESNYGFYLSGNNLKYTFEISDLNLVLFFSFRFEKSYLSFEKWKNSYSIEKLEGNQVEEEPQLIFNNEEQKFMMTFSKDEKRLNGKKLNTRMKFYITKI